MAKKRLWTIMILVAIWGTYQVATVHTFNSTVAVNMESILQSNSNRLQASTDSLYRQLEQGIAQVNDGDTDDFGLLLSLAELNEAFEYHMVFPDGSISPKAGNLSFKSGNTFIKAGSLGADTWESLQHNITERGYAMSVISGVDSLKGKIALLVPFGSDGNYVAEVRTRQEYLAGIQKHLTLPYENFSIYDSEGNLYSSLGNPGGEQGQAQTTAPGHLSKGRSLSYEKHGLQSFTAYIDLPAPNGWFIGVELSTMKLQPMMLHLMLASTLILFAGLFFVYLIGRMGSPTGTCVKNRYDSLTKLYNRDTMVEAMPKLLRQNRDRNMSLVCMDLVKFSRFCSMFGSKAGDNLLMVVAKTIDENYELGARMYNDIFTFLIYNDAEATIHMEDIFYKAISREMGSQYVQLMAFKFGVYPITDRSADSIDILNGAMLALKNAKQVCSKGHVVYDADLKRQEEQNRTIESNMLHALSCHEFLPFIQPKYDLRTGECCGGEVLVRWNSEQMGILMPDSFIPLFEKNGFIIELDIYMVHQTLQLLAGWIKTGVTPVPLSVNVSRISLAFPNFMDRLKSAVKEYDVPLELLEIEVTESAFSDNAIITHAALESMRDLGIRTAMDDFGSGYSSLAALRNMPIDIIKIDREFLDSQAYNQRGAKILYNVIKLAKDISITVVCEGVETKQQYDFLTAISCDIAQGYYLGKPMTARKFQENLWVSRHENEAIIK